MCNATAVTIIPSKGFGQSFLTPINGQTVSAAIYTYTANPGTTLCFDIILHGDEGRECCRTRICLDVTKECCDLKAKIYKIGCEPNSYVNIAIGGGTPPYSGPGNQGSPGNFWVLGLPSGTHTLTYTDSVGCEIDVTFTIQSEKCCGFAAEVTTLGACNETTVITVTGGTGPYSGPGWQPVPGTFVFIGGIPSGTYTYTYTDANGCEVDVTFTIPICCDMKAELLYTKGCAPDGVASIHITGGTPPYQGPGTQNALGYFLVDGLSSGDHDLTFTDANDCEVTITVTIDPCCEDEADCNDFLAITANANSSADIVVTSGITATLTAHLTAWCIPDRVFISKNGVPLLTLTAGSDGCDGYNECNDNDTEACVEFCVEPCDVILFEFEGDWCADSCPPSSTSWIFSITDCHLGCRNGGSRVVSDASSDLINLRNKSGFDPGSEGYLSTQITESVKVFPNPVTDILTISYSDPMIEYQTARIINSAGSLIHSENMSGQNLLQIDASTFPQGIYMLELTDSSGNKVIEKFSKMD